MEGIELAKETTAIDLACLLDAGEGAMVTLVAGDTHLVAHRAVMVEWSPIFAAMFRHDTLEARSGEVTITDVEGPALRQLLAFFYTAQDSQLPDMLAQLIVAADKYGVSVLKATCERQLAAQLSVETAAAAVFLAVRHCCPSLKQAAVAYIKTHLAEVMATQGWADAVRMQPEDVDEVSKLLSETSSAAPADSGTSPTVDTATTAGPPPQLQSLAGGSSTMEGIENAKGITAVDLGALLDACDDAVVTLVAGDTRLVAHRAVLVHRSPVFAQIFRHDTPESRSGQVTVEDVEGPVLRQLLSHLYTLRAPLLPGMASQLLVAAATYGVDSLKEACGQQVAAQLSVETAAALAVMAVRYNCESLKQASIAFLMDHTHKVMATRGWAEAFHSQPDDVIEVKKLLVAEMRSLPAWEKEMRLRLAAERGTLGELEALLAAGADVAAECGWGWTALHLAAYKGHGEAARALVAQGAPVEARMGDQARPLHRAAGQGCAAAVRVLLDASADHSARDSSGRTPLHLAAANGHTAVVRLLLAASADHSATYQDGLTALHWAAFRGHTEMAAALVEAGADRDATDRQGKTPLDFARDKNHQELVELLQGP